MKNELIASIDKTIGLIKVKDNSNSFSPENLLKFEFLLFLSMDIARYEILIKGDLTDNTSDAISQLFAFQCFEFYFRDFPDIYKVCIDLYSQLSDYNEKLKNHSLPGNIGESDEKWIEYFNIQLIKLLH